MGTGLVTYSIIQEHGGAVDSNIVVLDCTPHHKINTACYYDIFNVYDITKCLPGQPRLEVDQLDKKSSKI
jgi:hypothetical protein